MHRAFNILVYALIILSAVASRILPHAWNFAPVTAVAIVAAVYLPKKFAFGLPLIIRLISDAIIGFFSWPLMIAVYFCHLFGVVVGLWIKRNKSVARVMAGPVISSAVFFLVTNFAFLYSASRYTHDLHGVILAYANGLPFLRGTLLGDLFYTLILISVFESLLYFKRSQNLNLETKKYSN